MPSVQQTVDEVRTMVRSKDMTKSAKMAQVAEDLANASNLAEERLRRCQELLLAGYRCEAVSLSEIQPPLLDVLTQLNFEERNTWDELMAMYDLPTGPVISLSRASELNRAYADYSVVRDQVRQYRQLSRSRGPLMERAAILRELAVKDQNCHLWKEQLAALEETLKIELKNDITRDINNNDRSNMDKYFKALIAPGWVRPPLPTLVEMVARECIPAFLSRLRQAATSKALAQADSLQAEWDQLAKFAKIKPDEVHAQRASQCFEQFDQQRDKIARNEEIRLAMELLKDTLSMPTATEEEITGRYANVKALGVKIPPIIESQYEERLRTFEQRVYNKQIIFGVIGITCLAMMVISLLVFLRHNATPTTP